MQAEDLTVNFFLRRDHEIFCPGMSGTQASRKDWAKGGSKECRRK